MLQWCDDLDSAFREVRRVLKPDGLFAFTTFGPDTLRELRARLGPRSTATVTSNTFIDMHDIGDALGARGGSPSPVLDVERVTLTYQDVLLAHARPQGHRRTQRPPPAGRGGLMGPWHLATRRGRLRIGTSRGG